MNPSTLSKTYKNWITGRYKNDANMTRFASLSSHERNSLYEYQKNAAPSMVAKIIDVNPVQPKIHGMRLKGINSSEYTAI